ncbi:MAG: hypothetical protein JXA33_09345 [Anaerolineae bacterium]|nr:hypothetical protein [Anaerolineae bacterium]
MITPLRTATHSRVLCFVVVGVLIAALFSGLGLFLTVPGTLQAQELYPVVINEFQSAAPQAEPVLLHYWFFGEALPNDTPLEMIEATYSVLPEASPQIEFMSALDGYPFDSDHINWRKASMERRNAPTETNYRPEGNNEIPFANSGMRGLQIKQPFTGDGGENTLVFHLPTTGYQDVVFKFAAIDEGAAESLIFDYTTSSGGDNWTADFISATVPLTMDVFHLYTLDFSGIEVTNDNPNFKIRIRFAGPDMGVDDGDRVTFNNVSLDAVPLPGANLPPVVVLPAALQEMIAGGAPQVIDLATIFEDPDDDPLTFVALSSDIAVVSLITSSHQVTLTSLSQGDAVITLAASDGHNIPVSTTFRVLVYPVAHPMHAGAFTFTEWNPEQPERTYPDHMLFLQSDINDPVTDTLLLYPYFIPHNDYHADDQDIIGLPYSTTGRTRLNGLGEAGISFINTGRERDLGGALVALDTRGLSDLSISWLAGTVLQNDRVYALRLQYRVGITDPFTDVLVDGNPVEYVTNEDGHLHAFDQIPLPPDTLNRPYVQLLWRYYHVSVASGPRAQLRLDDIVITAHTVGVTFAPGYNVQAQPGEVFTFTHTLTNTGDITDTYLLIPGNDLGWDVVLLNEDWPGGTMMLWVLEIGPQTSYTFAIRVTIPVDESSGSVGITTVTATSQTNPDISATVANTITVTAPFRVFLPLVQR